MRPFALFLCLLATLRPGITAPPAARELITCGREQVHIFDLQAREPNGEPRKIWSWQAKGRKDLPPEYQTLFRSTDDCKPVDGGGKILITSSGSGVALVDRQTGAVLFYGRAANAHSADLLPNGRIAVAASRDSREQKGDALVLFDVKQSGRELWRTELPSGHGVVWDEKRQLLWALSDRHVRSYRLTDWSTEAPTLTRVELIELPESGGHELFPVPGSAELAVTTSNRCWLFDRDTNRIRPHPTLGALASIKCVSTHPATGQIAYVQADRPNWWSERIRFLQPEQTVSVAGEQFYKVRWNVP